MQRLRDLYEADWNFILLYVNSTSSMIDVQEMPLLGGTYPAALAICFIIEMHEANNGQPDSVSLS